VAREVPPCQLLERIITRSRSRGRYALVEQRVGRLRSATSAAADHPVDLRLHDKVRQLLDAVGANARALQNRLQLLAGEMHAAVECPHDRALASPERCRIELQMPVVRRHACADTRAGECQHPPDVRRRNKMPCRPQHVRAEDGAPGQCPFDRRVGRSP
jgi:hypothetical protein